MTEREFKDHFETSSKLAQNYKISKGEFAPWPMDHGSCMFHGQKKNVEVSKKVIFSSSELS